MSLLRKFLSQDNLSKYEKEQKKRYKQYVKLRITNSIVLSKPESEIYQDYLVRKKSLRRSWKRFSASKKEVKSNDIFREPSTSGTLAAAPAILDAVNRNVAVNHVPAEYLDDLKQIEGIKVEVNVGTDSATVNAPNQSNDIKAKPVAPGKVFLNIQTQELPKETIQSNNETKGNPVQRERKSSADVNNAQPLEQKFSFGNQEKFLDQLDEVIKSRNRSQPSPSHNHIYENAPDAQEIKNVPVAKPRKKATKKKDEDGSSVDRVDGITVEEGESQRETGDNRRNSVEVRNSFIPIEVQEKLNAAEQIFNDNQEIRRNVNQEEDEKVFTASVDKIDGIPVTNRKERNDSENFQAEHEELKWSTSFSGNMPEVARSESCITTQSEDSFFDCVSDNGDIYDDEEKNIMKQISPHFNKAKFSFNDGSETDSKSIDSVRVIDQGQEISLQTYEKELATQDDVQETDFRSITSEDIIAPIELNEAGQHNGTALREDQHEHRNHDVAKESDKEEEDNIDPDSLEIPPEPIEENHQVGAHNDHVQASRAETKQVKESEFISRGEPKEKLDEFKEKQTQNEALFLDENYRPPQSISNFRGDPEFLAFPYTQRSNKTHLIKLDNNNDYEDFETNQEKTEGKKVTFDFGKSYCQTYEVDNSSEESELVDSTLISALTKEEGQVFMPVDKKLYMRMQQSGRNKLRLSHDRNSKNDQHPQDERSQVFQSYGVQLTPEKERSQVFQSYGVQLTPEEERSQVFQSYGVQLTPEEEMIEKIFENSKNMDVAFLNCVDGFDLNIQQPSGSPSSEGIGNQIADKPDINKDYSDDQTKSPKAKDLKKPPVPPRTKVVQLQEVASEIEERENILTDPSVNGLDITGATVKGEVPNEAFVEDQPQESLKLIDFADDNRNIKTLNGDDQLISNRKSPEPAEPDDGRAKESDRRSSILDEPTPPSHIDLDPINAIKIEEDSKVKTRIFEEPIPLRPTSNELFNEFHISLENLEVSQKEITPANDVNKFGNAEDRDETKNIDKDNTEIYQETQSGSATSSLIPLEYLKENVNTLIENNKNQEENTQDKGTQLLTILESPFEKQQMVEDEESNRNENDIQDLPDAKMTAIPEDETVPQSPLAKQNDTVNARNDKSNDDDVFHNDVTPYDSLDNKTEAISDLETKAENISTNRENEEIVDSTIIRNPPLSSTNRNRQSPFAIAYVPGRRSVDLSKEISPPPTPAKFLSRSVSHNFFPTNRVRPKSFDRFKNKFPRQTDESDAASNSNDSTPVDIENANGDAKNSVETVAEIQERLTQISKMNDAGRQLVAMQDIVNRLKRKADSLSSRNDVEYLPLLQSLFKSVRVVSTFQCNFDEKLLASQQSTLKAVKKCIGELSLK